jgi:ataxia telangiectasia mutated family protein
MAAPLRLFGGPIAQFWKSQTEMLPFIRYLLLVDQDDSSNMLSSSQPSEAEPPSETQQVVDPSGYQPARKLALELLYPKVEELHRVAESWQKRGNEGGVPVSTERLQSLLLACLTGILVLPELSNLNLIASRNLETSLFEIVDATLRVILSAPSNENFFELILACSAPYIPPLQDSKLSALKNDSPHLLNFFGRLSEALHERTRRESSLRNQEVHDVDDEFESQTSQASVVLKAKTLPRRDILLSFTPEAFYLESALRVHLLGVIGIDDGAIGRVPEPIIDLLAELPKEQFLSCRAFIQELLSTDAIIPIESAVKVLELAGSIISTHEFSCCEVALALCLDIMDCFISLWTHEGMEITDMAGDLYHYLVKNCLPHNSLSGAAQIRLSELLLHVQEVKPDYASGLQLPSSRSTLLSILQDGPMDVKYFIGRNLPKIFGLYVLKTHDDIFVDVLQSLPADPRVSEGIAFRLFVLAELACRWPTLLRRCIYHIFETPGKIPDSAKYATSCLRVVSNTLHLTGPQELFALFAPQLLYTWLESDSIQDIPFQIFGFASLHDLLQEAQTEAAAIMMMRGQEKEAYDLAQSLGLTPEQLVLQSFTKIVAYCIAHDISVPRGANYVTGESRLKKLLGKEKYSDNVCMNFIDIVATFFDIFDQEDPIEKAFRRDEQFIYAAEAMDEIKKLGYLDASLPPNQQPMFKAKYLPREIAYMCNRLPSYPLEKLWTPSFVVFVARKLLNTIHPALGPLHACSVLRKIRVLICMAGSSASSGYPLEMLLHALRAFIVDPECADDALGITRYLIQKGDAHLKQTPSFLAGYALSSLSDLRVFLESSQASTTQESQFKATKSKAQEFHSWFSKYLANYESPAFRDEKQKLAFRSITQSAAQIRSFGNAEKGTHESNLLLAILEDWDRDNQLLNEPSREVALTMLCGAFKAPPTSRLDVIETDGDALNHSAVVWKSCASHQRLSGEYLAWAGRVLGRSFAASGEVPDELLRESQLKEYMRLTMNVGGSEEGLLNLIEALTVSGDCFTAGLAEAALRTIVTDATRQEDHDLITACQKSLSEPLLVASNWEHFDYSPRSDQFNVNTPVPGEVFSVQHLESPSFARELATLLAQSAPEIATLKVLPPILTKVKGFAERAFPFVVHLVLMHQLDKQQWAKRQLSDALREWLNVKSDAAKENLKLLINMILYLRIQAFPGEASIADRSHWLDINLSSAAEAAQRCGMFKVALLFVELASSEFSRASRRSSANFEEDSNELLLNIFENIDDPDAYYGISQDPSLSSVISRLEYENDGAKSLAFRGALYDTHLRSRAAGAHADGQALIKALSRLGLSGLSNSLLQTQQSLDGSSDSLDGTFTTARRLEIWNLPAPATSDNWAVTVYKAYQTMHQAPNVEAVRAAIHEGLKSTVRQLTNRSLNTSTLRHQLGGLAVLAELEDILNVVDKSEIELALQTFESRAKWMMSGR